MELYISINQKVAFEKCGLAEEPFYCYCQMLVIQIRKWPEYCLYIPTHQILPTIIYIFTDIF